MNYFYKKNQGHEKQQKKAGFTVLYAMLIAALMLSIGLSIYSVLLKELSLSSTASQSQIAIFAADSGIECALYWDTKVGATNDQTIFASSTNNGNPHPYWNMSTNAPCAYDTSITNANPAPNAAWSEQLAANAATSTFTVYLNPSGISGPCAVVTIGKVESLTIKVTDIFSLGYNVCDPNNPIRVERALRAEY